MSRDLELTLKRLPDCTGMELREVANTVLRDWYGQGEVWRSNGIQI